MSSDDRAKNAVLRKGQCKLESPEAGRLAQTFGVKIRNKDKMPGSNWTQKGATLSDKSARKEFGLTQEKIIDAIKSGKLQYRQNHIHGNPYFRLLRTEVESLAKELFGEDHLMNRKLQNELSLVNKEIRRLKKRMKTLEERKADLLNIIGE